MFKIYWGTIDKIGFSVVGSAKVSEGSSLSKEIETWTDLYGNKYDYQIRVDAPLLKNDGQIIMTIHPVLNTYGVLTFEFLK